MATNTENQSIPEVINQAPENTINEATVLQSSNNEERPKNDNSPKNDNERITQLENELKQKDTALFALKSRVSQLEKEVVEAQKIKSQHLKDTEEVAVLKAKSEDTLVRAKDIIFEKTKVIKNQELQIEALNQQIDSLKEVVSITKDLLEIRNLEVKQLETKINCIENRVLAEKERYDLMHKKLEHMIRYNGELKREYETQLCLFSALRERYNERELAKGVLEDNANSVRGTSSTAASSATNAASNVTNAASNVTNAASSIANAASSIAHVASSITNVASSTTDNAASSITNAASSIANAASSTTDNAASSITNAGSSIANAASSTTDNAASISTTDTNVSISDASTIANGATPNVDVASTNQMNGEEPKNDEKSL